MFFVGLIYEFSKYEKQLSRGLGAQKEGKEGMEEELLVQYNFCNTGTKREFLVFHLIPLASGCQRDFTGERGSAELEEAQDTVPGKQGVEWQTTVPREARFLVDQGRWCRSRHRHQLGDPVCAAPLL